MQTDDSLCHGFVLCFASTNIIFSIALFCVLLLPRSQKQCFAETVWALLLFDVQQEFLKLKDQHSPRSHTIATLSAHVSLPKHKKVLELNESN